MVVGDCLLVWAHERLAIVVAHVTVRLAEDASGLLRPGSLQRLSLDVERIDSLDEGWIPVVTPGGPGTLIWPNSD